MGEFEVERRIARTTVHDGMHSPDCVAACGVRCGAWCVGAGGPFPCLLLVRGRLAYHSEGYKVREATRRPKCVCTLCYAMLLYLLLF